MPAGDATPASSARPTVVVTAPWAAQRAAAVLGAAADVRTLRGLGDADRAALFSQADVLLVGDWERELAGVDHRALRPRLVQLLSAGADRFPFDELPAGAVLASNVGGWAEPMAEHILAMVLAFEKRLAANHAKLAAGVWDQTPTGSLAGAHCLIVGYGGIGRATARLLRAFGAVIHAINTSGRTDDPVASAGTLDDLPRLLPEADVVVLSVPLTRRTRGLVGAAELAAMRPDAILVNVARGPVVDEAALFAHLVTHPGFRAALDVWWDEPMRDGRFHVGHPFLGLPNVLGSPHNSALVAAAPAQAVERAAGNVARFLAGAPLLGVVDPADYR
jgi:phosphoglycerate dehydrogenase-like enzyme